MHPNDSDVTFDEWENENYKKDRLITKNVVPKSTLILVVVMFLALFSFYYIYTTQSKIRELEETNKTVILKFIKRIF